IQDHPALLRRLAASLADGGQLAFQVPASHDQSSHLIAEDLIQEYPFQSAAGGWHKPQPVLEPEQYARLFYQLGFDDPNVRLIVYPHVLQSAADVVEWMKGTLLTEYARHLPVELFEEFVRQYQARLLHALEPAEPFFFPFKRILCWGRRSST